MLFFKVAKDAEETDERIRVQKGSISGVFPKADCDFLRRTFLSAKLLQELKIQDLTWARKPEFAPAVSKLITMVAEELVNAYKTFEASLVEPEPAGRYVAPNSSQVHSKLSDALHSAGIAFDGVEIVPIPSSDET